MKKLRYLFIIIFIGSLSILGFQLVDRIRAAGVEEEVKEIYNSQSEIKSEKEKEIEEKNQYNFKVPEYKILSEFEPLLEENENTVGWIKVDGTKIDYPLVQGMDNDFYLKHDFYDNYSAHGSIYMDFRNRKDLRDKHTIIYGHHIKNGTMFHNLVLYKDEEFFNENKIITLKSLYGEEKYEIFSSHIYENDPYIIKTRFDNGDFEVFLDKLKEISDHEVSTEVTKDDKILSLITCTYEFKDARYVVHARKIE